MTRRQRGGIQSTNKKRKLNPVANTTATPEFSRLFGSVPAELLEQIFQYLQFKKKHAILLVCSNWKSIVTPMIFNEQLELYRSFISKSKGYSETLFGSYEAWVDAAYGSDDDSDTEQRSHLTLEIEIDKSFDLRLHSSDDREDIVTTNDIDEVTTIDEEYYVNFNSSLPEIKVCSDHLMEDNYELDPSRCSVTDVHFPMEQRTKYRELLQSINSLKSKVSSGTFAKRSEYLFEMNNNQIWLFTSDTIITKQKDQEFDEDY